MSDNSRSGFWAVFKRECLRVVSSKICIWGIFVVPVISLLVMVTMMSEGLPTKIPIAVVDLDNSKTSRGLIRQLDAFPKTDIKLKSLSFKDAREQMEKGEVFGVFVIPRDFSKKAISGQHPKLTFYTNNSFLISGSLLFQDLKSISVLASASVGLQTATAKGRTTTEIMPVIQPISVKSNPLGNPWLNYSVYLNNTILPAILQLMIMMFTVSCIGSEVKAGTGKHLLKIGDNSILKVIAGKMLAYTFAFSINALLFMSVFYYYSKFPLNSGFLPMFLNYVGLIVASQGMGLVLIGIFANYRFALSIASLLGSVSFSLVGFSFPALAMSPDLYALSYIFPLRHFFLIYVDQALNGIPIGYSAYNYAALLGFLFIGLLFTPRIRKFLATNIYEE